MILVVCFITSLSFLVVLDQNLVRLSYDISAKKKNLSFIRKTMQISLVSIRYNC